MAKKSVLEVIRSPLNCARLTEIGIACLKTGTYYNERNKYNQSVRKNKLKTSLNQELKSVDIKNHKNRFDENRINVIVRVQKSCNMFEALVQENFRFLVEKYGFLLKSINASCAIWYKKNDNVQIFYDSKRSYEIDLSICHKQKGCQKSYHLDELLSYAKINHSPFLQVLAFPMEKFWQVQCQDGKPR